MRILKYFTLSAMSLMMISCGGKKEQESEGEENNNPYEVTVNIESQLGELGEYMMPNTEEMVVKVNRDEYNDRFLDMNGVVTFNVPNTFTSSGDIFIYASFLDKDHVEIWDRQMIDIKATKKDGEYILYTGTARGEMKHTFILKEASEIDPQWEEIVEKAKYILLTPFSDSNRYSLYQTQTSYVEEEEDDSKSPNWDILLDQYEGLVKKYISMTNKLKNGDYEALTEGPQLADKAEELELKFKNAEDEMSSSQWKRYMDLNMKMANAMKELME